MKDSRDVSCLTRRIVHVVVVERYVYFRIPHVTAKGACGNVTEELFVLTLLLCSLVPVWKRLAFNIYITHPRRVVSLTQGCIRREGTSEAAPEAVRQAVGGGCQSGGGRLLSVTKAVEAATGRQGDSGWA